MTRAVVGVVAACMGFGFAGLSGAQTTLTRTSAFEYEAGSGLLIREIIEPNDAALCLVNTYLYDAYGNKKEATTRNCNAVSPEVPAPTGDAVFASRTSYTDYLASPPNISPSWSAGQFPTNARNALGHEEIKEFDPRFGTVTKLTGPNGLVTTWAYDGFGRKSNETRSDGTQTNWAYTLCVGAACPEFGKMFVTETTDGAPTKKVYFDSLNREIRIEVVGFDGNAVYKDTKYDGRGRVDKVSKPYLSGATIYWTTYQYDDLNRVTQVDEPATTSGTTRTATAYNGLITTVTVSNAGAGTNMPEGVAQTRVTTKNSQGQVVQVTDAQGNNVTYSYDPFGNLKTTNAGGVITQLSYDLRGRKKQMMDPDMGTWTYDYNALGELIRQSDAKSQVTTMIYDKLGRMTSRTEPDLVSTWFYDTYQGGAACNKGKGKLCQVTATNNYSRTLSYDNFGRLATLSASLDTSYQISYSYDSSGRLNTVTYPQTGTTGTNPFTVQNVYKATGYLWKVQRVNDADATVYWTANSQNAAGQITSELLGNGLTTTYGYDELFRQNGVQSANAGGTVHSHTYGFDAIGNVIQRIDNFQAITENFIYDKLNRLIQASGNPTLVTRSFAYNAIGNMTYKSDVGAYTYPAIGTARPHAVSNVSNGGAPNSINGTYGYDLNGSLISASGMIFPASGASVAFSRTLTYTSFNMPATIAHTQGASSYSYTYTYSVEHERVRLVTVRPDDTLTSIYLHPAGKGALLYEKEIRASDGRIEHKHYVNGGAGLVGVFVTKSTYATGEGPQMRYYHRDHLGSIAVITNPSGAVLERLSYEVFGERRNANGSPQNRTSPLFGVTTDRGFTAHEHLDELNLIHMNGRVYDPAIARFVTADPFVQAADNLQSFNHYSYVLNSPLMHTDPSGYFSVKRLAKAFVKFHINPSIRNAAHLVREQPFQHQIDNFVMKNKYAYAIGQAAATYFTSAFCGGCGGAIWTAYYTELATGSSTAAFKAGAISYASQWVGGQVNAAYGGSYSIQRVFVEASIDGVRAELSGGNFGDGFKQGLVFSGLAYVNAQAREFMIEQSKMYPANATGVSVGLNGDGFKLGGARMIQSADLEISKPESFWETFLGGRQGGEGTIAGFSYSAGSLADRVVEAWAGPHDLFNYFTGTYNSIGNVNAFSGVRSFASEVSNAAGVLIVAPAAIAGLVRSENIPIGGRPRH